MKIEWDCAIKALGSVAVFALFIAFIATGGFVGNPLLSLAVFFSVCFSALGFCLYKACVVAKQARESPKPESRAGSPASSQGA